MPPPPAGKIRVIENVWSGVVFNKFNVKVFLRWSADHLASAVIMAGIILSSELLFGEEDAHQDADGSASNVNDAVAGAVSFSLSIFLGEAAKILFFTKRISLKQEL